MQRIVKTIIRKEDQDLLLKLLESPSGERIRAWMQENSPAGPVPGSPEHMYVHSEGKRAGYEEFNYRLRQLALAPLVDINGLGDDLDEETGE